MKVRLSYRKVSQVVSRVEIPDGIDPLMLEYRYLIDQAEQSPERMETWNATSDVKIGTIEVQQPDGSWKVIVK